MPARPALLARVLDQIKLAVYVFEAGRQIYANEAAAELAERLRADDHTELAVLIADHLTALERTAARERRAAGSPNIVAATKRPKGPKGPTVTLLTSPSGEPFYIHVLPLATALAGVRQLHAVTVRSTGADIASFRQRYRLTPREGDITELVRRGWSNRDIARKLEITVATTKKHLGRVFDKVGADSRAHLIAKLG